MSLAHLTLPTRHVEKTIAFFEETLGYARRPAPGNSPVDALWLDIGRGQQIHVVHVDPLEPRAPRVSSDATSRCSTRGLTSLAEKRLVSRGAELMAPLRDTPFERFFFRDPVNGYVFEVIEEPPDLLETSDERRASGSDPWVSGLTADPNAPSEPLCEPLRPVERQRHLARIDDPVEDVARAVQDGARPDLGDLAIALDLAGAVGDDEKFLFGMPVRRMRARTGIEHRHAGAHAVELVGRTVVMHEHPAAVLVVIRHRREVEHPVHQLRQGCVDAYDA